MIEDTCKPHDQLSVACQHFHLQLTNMETIFSARDRNQVSSLDICLLEKGEESKVQCSSQANRFG